MAAALRRLVNSVTEKCCPCCGDWKPETPAFFHKRKGHILHSPCKVCMNNEQRERTARKIAARRPVVVALPSLPKPYNELDRITQLWGLRGATR
jgi:hypothetical protein